MRALLYARVSYDRDGQGRSVDEQLVDLREWVTRRGWEITKEIRDDAISASRHAKRKRRPGWDEVVSLIERGDVDVLAVWENSRTTRQLGEWAQLRDLLRDRGVLLLASDQVVDFSDLGQSLTAGIRAVVDEDESERTRARIRRTMRSQAQQGRPHGRRLYGYRRVYDDKTGALVGQVPEPDEAAVVAEIVDRVAHGEGMRTIASELNERGLTTNTGKAWTGTQVRRVVTNWHYAAKRVHHGEPVADAVWEPIVTAEALRAAIDRVSGNGHGRATPSSAARYLLSGVLICGRCGESMRMGRDRGRRLVYTCRNASWVDPETGKVRGVGHLTATMGAVDEHVVEVIAAWLDRPDVAKVIAATSGNEPDIAAVNELEALRSRLDDAAAAYGRGEISVTMLAKLEAQLTEQITALEREITRTSVPVAVADALGRDFRSLDVATQREVIRSIVRPVLLPGARGARTFDTDRVRFDWQL